MKAGVHILRDGLKTNRTVRVGTSLSSPEVGDNQHVLFDTMATRIPRPRKHEYKCIFKDKRSGEEKLVTNVTNRAASIS